jgi:transcriptional regulator with XRE-family HTH domain
VRTLVAGSGLSKRDFAERIGTSRSRLSTYLSGKVVPSATLMVRMRRVALHASEMTQAASQAGWSCSPLQDLVSDCESRLLCRFRSRPTWADAGSSPGTTALDRRCLLISGSRVRIVPGVLTCGNA